MSMMRPSFCILIACLLAICIANSALALESTTESHGVRVFTDVGISPSPPGPYTPPLGFPKPIPRGVLDLGLPPRERWHALVDEVIQTHGWEATFGHVTRYFEVLIPVGIRETVLAVAKLAELTFDEDDKEFMEELRGSVERANMQRPDYEPAMSVAQGLVLNILYELTAGCTSVVASDTDGTIWHGRTLDWPLPANIRFTNLTYLLDVINSTEGGSVVYRGTHTIGFVGANTGMRPRAFSVSLDERHLPDPRRVIIDNIAHLLSQDRASPVTWLLRRVLMENVSYSEAVREFSDFIIGAPAYLIAGGLRYPQGAVITRKWNATQHPWYLGDGSQPWYLVQTNYDHWETAPPIDNRRGLAEASLDSLGHSGMNLKGMMQVLQTQGVANKTRGVLNGDTLFSVVMNSDRNIIEGWLWQ